ncbi:MAG: 23S rRNA (guanosine(2251)-2'-O)-methyltransferase RlmB [Treponema sp.]|nr:23S rRNA (guanosine(2251)-2'-O)-methyltransferase RlmB [Treponema sp.]
MKVFTGFHSIEEKVNVALKEGNNSKEYKIFYSKPGPRVKKILEAAKKAGILAEQVNDKKLDELVVELPEALQDHRGIVMTIAGEQKKAENLVDLDTWIKTRTSDSEKTTVVVLDRVTDPHNVGAIIRSCDQFGANLVIIPEHNSANDISGNEIIGRASAGASAWVPVAVVNNLVRAVEKLKEAGFWVYGADAGGESCRKIDFASKSVLVMGSEGTGIAQLLEKQCDSIVSIPTCGKIDSLNVSVAAGILLYELSNRQ